MLRFDTGAGTWKDWQQRNGSLHKVEQFRKLSWCPLTRQNGISNTVVYLEVKIKLFPRVLAGYWCVYCTE